MACLAYGLGPEDLGFVHVLLKHMVQGERVQGVAHLLDSDTEVQVSGVRS